MNHQGKDSPEVVKFMALFSRLKDWSDDTPHELSEQAARDESLRDLCDKVWLAAYFLRVNERRARRLFAAPVDPAFLSAWRDYEERYEAAISGIWLSHIFPDHGESSNPPNAHLQWGNANADAAEQAQGIDSAIEFAQFNADQEDRWIDQTEFIEGIQEGIAAWERLKQDTGFDLRGVFRRRALIPFVLVPRRVAVKHGNAETFSMLKNLQEAHHAFVFGSTYGALALMRSVMEAVLRDHYQAAGSDLNELIRSARRRLPQGANEAALHRLRKLANAVLHLDREKDAGLPNMTDERLEKEIVWLLYVLRALIEGAKLN